MPGRDRRRELTLAEILSPHHRFQVDARLGALRLAVVAELSAPWTVLFGPSGSGKSTLLRALCGLVPEAAVTFSRCVSEAPRVLVEDLPRVAGTVWTPLTLRPTHRRDLAYSPQHAALFPHLSVRDNVRFPFQVCSEPPLNSGLVDEALTLFHLHSLVERMPRDLSGGERRRVSLARAFATPSARLMILDEPFSGLDRGLRDELLVGLRAALVVRGLPVLSVTHDVDEALLLEVEVLRMEGGEIVARGAAGEVLRGERDRLMEALGRG